MKTNITIAIAAIMICLGSNTGNAANRDNIQDPMPSREQMIQQSTDRMVMEYGLNSTQAKKLLKLNKKYPQMTVPLMRGGMPPKGDWMEGAPDANFQPRERPRFPDAPMKDMNADREAYEKKLKKIMTEEQYRQYLKNPRPGPRPDQFGPVQQNK